MREGTVVFEQSLCRLVNFKSETKHLSVIPAMVYFWLFRRLLFWIWIDFNIVRVWKCWCLVSAQICQVFDSLDVYFRFSVLSSFAAQTHADDVIGCSIVYISQLSTTANMRFELIKDFVGLTEELETVSNTGLCGNTDFKL